ncbi:MAG: hypothetical protein AABY93_17280 [Bacteroidota bacterium]
MAYYSIFPQDGQGTKTIWLWSLCIDTRHLFYFTASHVADYLDNDDNQLFIRVGKGKFINVIGEIKFTNLDRSSGIDLAYIKIDQQMIPDLVATKKPITIGKISKHNKTLDGSNYCVIGFPVQTDKLDRQKKKNSISCRG